MPTVVTVTGNSRLGATFHIITDAGDVGGVADLYASGVGSVAPAPTPILPRADDSHAEWSGNNLALGII